MVKSISDVLFLFFAWLNKLLAFFMPNTSCHKRLLYGSVLMLVSLGFWWLHPLCWHVENTETLVDWKIFSNRFMSMKSKQALNKTKKKLEINNLKKEEQWCWEDWRIKCHRKKISKIKARQINLDFCLDLLFFRFKNLFLIFKETNIFPVDWVMPYVDIIMDFLLWDQVA